MKSRQKIKVLKIIGEYDRRGKKYNGKPLTYFLKDYQNQNLRHITRLWYESKKFLKKFRSGRKMKMKEIVHITD